MRPANTALIVFACAIGGFTLTSPGDYDVIPALETAVDQKGGLHLLD